MALLAHLLLSTLFLQLAYAQSGSPTPEMLEECRGLGIEPKKCSEEAILGTKCIGPCGPSEAKLDSNLIPLLAGIGIAGAVGIFAVKKLGSSSKNTHDNH